MEKRSASSVKILFSGYCLGQSTLTHMGRGGNWELRSILRRQEVNV